MGAARKHGRFDRAYPLAAEMLAIVGELPNGVLALPRLLSNMSDAPMLGEAAILWQLSIQPQPGFPLRNGGGIPAFVYIVLGLPFLCGVGLILSAIAKFRRTKGPTEPVVSAAKFQLTAWAGLILGAAILFLAGQALMATPLLLAGVLLPVRKKAKSPKAADNPPKENPPVLTGQP